MLRWQRSRGDEIGIILFPGAVDMVALGGILYSRLGAKKMRKARAERREHKQEFKWREGHAPSFISEDKTTRM